MGALRNWLFDNPRRFAVASALGLLVLIGAGFALGGSNLTGMNNPKPTLSDSGQDTTTLTYQDPAGAQVQADVPNPERFIQAAVQFTQEWAQAKPGESPAQWRSRVIPLATAEFGQALSLTELSSLPQTTPQGAAGVQFVAGSSALIRVPLADSTSVFVTVVKLGSAYRISDIQPAVGDDGLPPGTEP